MTEPSALETLLEVQDLDTAITQLEHRQATMEERAELARVRAALGALEARGRSLATERAALAARLSELEDAFDAVTGRRQNVERRMLEARGSSARDLQAMDDEVHHLDARRLELEDEELAVMEAQEPLEAEAAQVAVETAQLEEAAAGLRAAVAAADTVLDAELATLRMSRGLAADRLPEDLASRYEVIRARSGGVGAARLVGNRCSGCHMELAAMEVERLRRLPPDELVTCEQCGRILVRTTGS